MIERFMSWLDGDLHLFVSFQDVEYVVEGNVKDVGEVRRREGRALNEPVTLQSMLHWHPVPVACLIGTGKVGRWLIIAGENPEGNP